MNGYPEFETQYMQDMERWGSRPLSEISNPESPIADKVGTVDYADSGFIVVCGGFMGNETLSQQHYVNSVDAGITWLKDHGCTRIVNLCN